MQINKTEETNEKIQTRSFGSKTSTKYTRNTRKYLLITHRMGGSPIKLSNQSLYSKHIRHDMTIQTEIAVSKYIHTLTLYTYVYITL